MTVVARATALNRVFLRAIEGNSFSEPTRLASDLAMWDDYQTMSQHWDIL
jgi:hypothetical protein